MLDETVTSTKTEKDTLLMEMTQLQKEKENLQNIYAGESFSCAFLLTVIKGGLQINRKCIVKMTFSVFRDVFF